MIITNVCLLLEALSIVICLHHLYGEKFRLDIATVCLLAVDMIMMQMIDYFHFPSNLSILIYPLIFIYCGKKFGFNFKVMCINVLICVIWVGIIQLIMLYIFGYWLNIRILVHFELLLASGVTFLITLYVLPKLKVKKLSIFLQDKEKLLFTTICVCIISILIGIINYKKMRIMDVYQTITLFVFVTLLFALSVQLGKYKIKTKEIETELKMHKLYASSFEGLIEHIRLRQHEFDNHINTIYSQHYIYNTYEELINAQKSYCQLVTKENQFNNLLINQNPIIVGFLYGKFVEIDKMGIEITYRVNVKEMDIGVPIYKIVEILGDLINNAVEALLAIDNNKLYVSIEQKEELSIEIRNESPYVEYNEINAFFTKGYSRKGENRGLGLYNVRQICSEYQMEVSCLNKEIDNCNWLVFQVTKKERTI